jgi:hypothetical protein
MNFTSHMIFFDLHHSGTQFFLRNVDIVFDPRIRQLHFPGGVSTPKAKNNSLYLTSTKKAVSVRTLDLTSEEKQSVCGRSIFNVHISASSV